MFGKNRQQGTRLTLSAEALYRKIFRRAKARLSSLASHDRLAAIDRASFRGDCAHVLRNVRRDHDDFALLFIAIDSYCRLNETLGPAVADQLIRWARARLRNRLRPTDLFAYWGGDEFVVGLQSRSRARLDEEVAVLQEQLAPPFRVGKHEFCVTSSVGIATYPAHGRNVEALIRNASAALLKARESGGNHHRVYAPEMNANGVERLTFESSLRRALQRNEFEVYYQPQVSTQTWRVLSAEALIRWNHPDLGLLSPAQFIPLAEETGLIVSIGAWVLRTACTQLATWHKEGFRDIDLAVNVSARQFYQTSPADTIEQLLRELELDPEHLTLELTESSLMRNAEHVATSLDRLNKLGVRLSLDDFGTGFSSFEYLRRLQLHSLKIDETFVRNATRNIDDAAVVATIIALAKKLRLKVVAEGIENEEQLKFLYDLQCDAMQGYLFARPLPAAQFRQLLASVDYRLTDRLIRLARDFRNQGSLSGEKNGGVSLGGRPSMFH